MLPIDSLRSTSRHLANTPSLHSLYPRLNNLRRVTARRESGQHWPYHSVALKSRVFASSKARLGQPVGRTAPAGARAPGSTTGSPLALGANRVAGRAPQRGR